MPQFKKNKKGSRSRLVSPLTVFLVVLLVVGFGGCYFLNFRQTKVRSLLKSSQSEIPTGFLPGSELTLTPTQVPSDLSSTDKFFLEISSPKNEAKVKDDYLWVKGKTLPGVEVFVNEVEVTTDHSGFFEAKIALEEGENPILIVAGDENAEAEVERTVFYEKY